MYGVYVYCAYNMSRFTVCMCMCVLCIQYVQVHCVYGIYVYCVYNMSRFTVYMVYMCIVYIICPGSLCVWYICVLCI